jgi:hypothetical protein
VQQFHGAADGGGPTGCRATFDEFAVVVVVAEEEPVQEQAPGMKPGGGVGG